MAEIIDVFLHIDVHLNQVISQYGVWTNALLFLVVFCETGLVVTHILPGDSLLFAAGAFAASGSLDLLTLLVVLSLAAILGDAANYGIGKFFGPKVLSGNHRFLRKEYLDRTHQFYERYGGKTVIFARFVPIVRTFAPFMAGVGRMRYSRFASFNVFGGLGWVISMTLGGYYLGSIPWIQRHFEAVVILIVLVSVSPLAIQYFRSRR